MYTNYDNNTLKQKNNITANALNLLLIKINSMFNLTVDKTDSTGTYTLKFSLKINYIQSK